MKEYLSAFLDNFAYSREDSQALLEAYDKINEKAEPRAIFNTALKIYEESYDCNYNKILELSKDAGALSDVHEYTAQLLVFMCMSRELKERYMDKGIDLSIYENSMLDLKYKLEECKIVKGICGSFVAGWFVGFFNLTRFALGRLQFEISELWGEYKTETKFLPDKAKVINVHIPRSGTPIDKASCDEAYEMALNHFKDKTDTGAFVCYSWLLYPENENLFPKHTNMYRFFKEFDVYKSGDSEDNGDLWRLFDTDEKDVDKLPADTSVRRAYVEHLKNGGKTGWGYGIQFR